MKEYTAHVIRGDDSGHEYAVPVDKVTDWDKWIGSDDWRAGIVPDYAQRIDGEFMFYMVRHVERPKQRDRMDPDSCSAGKICDNPLCRWQCQEGRSDT